MLVKDTELYKTGCKKLEQIKERSLLKINVKKDRPRRTLLDKIISIIV